jgi:3',5'-nucleoside bisphosphate phosphatase
MTTFRADLHIHTVLSPCGSLEMSPDAIVREASGKGLDIIGITDHNTTRHCRLVRKLAEKAGIFVLTGAEITTKEEVHCLVFFEKIEELDIFQEYLDLNLPDIKNDPDLFGDQVEIDEEENIVYTEERLLTNATAITLEELEVYTHSNNGIFIPAHADRMKNSIYSQLGFMPSSLKADAIELSSRTDPGVFCNSHPELRGITVIRSSDAHHPGMIGAGVTRFEIESRSFEEIKMALRKEKKRNTII